MGRDCDGDEGNFELNPEYWIRQWPQIGRQLENKGGHTRLKIWYNPCMIIPVDTQQNS